MRRASLADRAAISSWTLRDFGKEEDFTGFLSNPENVCLIEGDGAGFFLFRAPGIYEVHLALEQRGRDAMNVLGQMFEWMRNYGATRFMAAVPVDNRKVKLFTRLMGFTSVGFDDLPHGRCEIFIGE